MPLLTPETSVEISVSTMCVGPLELPGVPTWRADLDQLESFLEQTNYCNYEVHPTTTIVRNVADRERYPAGLADSVIGSLHQTFNEGKGKYGIVANLYGVQHTRASIHGMRVIQQALSRPVPSVHYVGRHTTAHIPASRMPELPGYPGSFPIVQPKPEIYRDFGIKDPGDLMDVMRKVGMVGLCPDTVHSREKAKPRKHEKEGTPSPPWREVWANQFASGDVYQMHVSADRRDVKKHDPELAIKSQQEFKAFVSGTWDDVMNTELSDMIIQAIENWVPPRPLLHAIGAPVLRMVVEIPPWTGRVLRRVDDHKKFIATLVTLIEKQGATPLLRNSTIPPEPVKV